MFSDHFLFLGNSLIFFDLLCADVAFDYATAYPYLCYSFARSAGGLSTFSILVPLSTSARLCTCLFGLRSRPRGLIFICFAQYLPKPMFVFAFEGALFAFIVNGDRFVLFALLPRRKPRTSRQCSRLIIPKNSTSPPAGTPIPVCRLTDGMDFCVLWQWHRCHT